MDQSNLRAALAKVCDLQPYYSPNNTLEMQQRGRFVRRVIPTELRALENPLAGLLGKHGHDFLVDSSDGIGRKTEAQWVRFCSESLSPNPRTGYYMVIHFSRDGSALYVTLGCGSTVWDGGALTALADDEIYQRTSIARRAILQTHGSVGRFVDQIRLGAKAKLPQTFEKATVIARRVPYGEVASTDFVELFCEAAQYLSTVYDMQETGKDVSNALQQQEEINRTIRPVQRAKTGQGFSLSGDERKAVELQAMKVASAWFNDNGYKVKDTSMDASFDLLVEKDGLKTKVEVKGTTSAKFDSFVMTQNEVALHLAERGKTFLLLVCDINLTRGETATATGGHLEVFQNWDIEGWERKPIAFTLTKRP